MTKRYIFTVVLSGMGPNEDAAWQDAIEQFQQDPGPTPEQFEVEDEEDN